MRQNGSPEPGTRPASPADDRAPPTPTAADLAWEVRDVLADLPRFLTAPLLRPWHRRWSATRAEVTAAMPGDDRLPRAQLRCTRAITITAPPGGGVALAVQVGWLRAGWEADDLLDNLAHPSARQAVPQLQDLRVGQWLPMAPNPTETTACVVDSFEAPRCMLWRTPTSTWAWRLTPLPDGRTRLIARLRVAWRAHRRVGLDRVLHWLPAVVRCARAQRPAGGCPLTGLAEHAGAASGSVTDIYLRTSFAANLPAIHSPLLVLIGWMHPEALHRGCRAT